jgi:plasmid stabilization system protein ParE
LQHLASACTFLRQFPQMAPQFRGAYRRLLIPGFPFGMFYSIEGSRIIIAAIMDLRQDLKTFADGSKAVKYD